MQPILLGLGGRSLPPSNRPSVHPRRPSLELSSLTRAAVKHERGFDRRATQRAASGASPSWTAPLLSKYKPLFGSGFKASEILPKIWWFIPWADVQVESCFECAATLRVVPACAFNLKEPSVEIRYDILSEITTPGIGEDRLQGTVYEIDDLLPILQRLFARWYDAFVNDVIPKRNYFVAQVLERLLRFNQE